MIEAPPADGTTAAGETRRRPAAERGRLEIHPTVLRKIVEQAADQVPGTARHERRLAGIDVGEVGAVARVRPGRTEPIRTDPGRMELGAVDIALELTLRYPAAVRGVVEAVRERVDTELTELAGYRLRALSVTVSGLRGSGSPAPARLR